MPRLMSVALTTEQVRAQQKTVTRRAGWQVLRPGDLVTLCPKVRGRRAGEALERIVTVEIVSTRRERLDAITADDVVAEGFPGMTPPEFVAFFIASHRGVSASSEITRIEWAYPRVCRACGCTALIEQIKANPSGAAGVVASYRSPVATYSVFTAQVSATETRLSITQKATILVDIRRWTNPPTTTTDVYVDTTSGTVRTAVQ